MGKTYLYLLHEKHSPSQCNGLNAPQTLYSVERPNFWGQRQPTTRSTEELSAASFTQTFWQEFFLNSVLPCSFTSELTS